MIRQHRLGLAVSVVVVSLGLGACSSDSNVAVSTTSTQSSTSPPTDATPGTADTAPDSTESSAEPTPSSVLSGTGVLDRVGPSVALIETPVSSGTAILIDGGYLVTSAHVVEPYRTVSVVLDGESPIDAEVIGVDLAADVALIGPIETSHSPIEIVTGADLPRGADLYLVGYPGDVDDPQVTIARGVLSRRREVPDWGLHLIQTDAAIGGGQSGGALVDDSGAVVGMSGFALDQFALALDGGDVARIAEQLKHTSDPEWEPLPADDQITTTTATFSVDEDGVALYLPSSGTATLHVTIDHPEGVAIVIASTYGETLAINEVAAQQWQDVIADEPTLGDAPAPTAAISPGVWDFPTANDEPLAVSLSSATPVTVQVTMSAPFAALPGVDGPHELTLGTMVEGVASFTGTADRYRVTLTSGQRIDVQASSALGDIDVYLYDPANPDDEGQSFADGGGGIFDLDAKGTFTAPHDGQFALDVYAADGASTRYRLIATTA